MEEVGRGQSFKVTVWSPQGSDNGTLGNPNLKVSDLESQQVSQNLHHIGFM